MLSIADSSKPTIIIRMAAKRNFLPNIFLLSFVTLKFFYKKFTFSLEFFEN